MAEGKRYYWLKLKDDFFSSKRIKKLRRMAGGDTYLIIYLKMQLKAIRTDGVLQWTGLESEFADELALDLDEQPDDVRMTLAYLMSCGLIETSDNVNFLLPFAVENTGSETASTQRSREWRANRKLLQCNTDATNVQQGGNVEKDIEKEKDIEYTVSNDTVCRTKDVRRIVEAWNSLGLQQISKVTSDSKRGGMLRARVNEYGVDAVLKAIDNIRESPYLKGQNGSGWVITFEWFVKPNNFLKVFEDNYREVRKNGAGESVHGQNNGGTPQSRWGAGQYKYD